MQNKTTDPIELEKIEDAELEQIAKKHNADEVYKLRVPLNSDFTQFAECFLKYPSLHAYSISLTLEDTHPLKGKLILLGDMFLEGDRRLLDPEKSTENMKIFLRACTAIDRIVDLKAASIKKKSMTTL